MVIRVDIKPSMNFQNEDDCISFIHTHLKGNPSRIGVFLCHESDVNKWVKKLNKESTIVITSDCQNIYDFETIDFLKALANIKKNGFLIRALNYPSMIIDENQYKEYRDIKRDVRPDWKILEENKELILNIDEYQRKYEYIKKYYYTKKFNIHDELIDIERIYSQSERINGYQKLQFTSLQNYAANYDKADTLDSISDFLYKYEKQELLRVQEIDRLVVLFSKVNPIDLSYDYVYIPDIQIDETKLRNSTISINEIDDPRLKYRHLISASFITYVIYKDSLSNSLRTKLSATDSNITIYTGDNSKEIMLQDKVYQELLERGVLTKTHQKWIDSIYTKYASKSKYIFFANEIIELYKNLFNVILAFDKELTTFETSLGSIRVFLRFTLKIILDSLLNNKEENINFYLKAHTSHSSIQNSKTYKDSLHRVSLIEILKEKKVLKPSFSDQDFLNLSTLKHFLDSAAHRGDINKIKLEDEMRVKFKNLKKKDQLEILLSIFKFIYSLELNDKLLDKVNNTMKKYYIFDR